MALTKPTWAIHSLASANHLPRPTLSALRRRFRLQFVARCCCAIDIAGGVENLMRSALEKGSAPNLSLPAFPRSCCFLLDRPKWPGAAPEASASQAAVWQPKM
jgi:hypothetical protein